MNSPPATVGCALSEIETPALIVALDAYERNLDRMTRSLSGSPVRLRPHAKTHKCPIIARHQMDRGATGICCQTLGEAEAMVAGGIPRILITNEVISPGKMRRLAQLNRQAEVITCVDHPSNIRELDAIATSLNVVVPMLVEIDVGQRRCGIQPGESALTLAKQVVNSPGLRFVGLQAYLGNAQHIYDLARRTESVNRAIDGVRQTANLLKASGIPCLLITGGGTGTYTIDAASHVYNEVQPGSYVFMDADYGKVEGAPQDFENALFVLTSVISSSNSHAVCDAGLKASSIDSGLPIVYRRENVRYVGASDEHGTLEISSERAPLPLGERVWLVPGHCDPTVNLYDWFVAIRGDRVEAVWPITVRGASN